MTGLTDNPINTLEVSAYAYDEMVACILSARRRNEHGTLIFDITCLTKIHTLALAARIGMHRLASNAICYSSPENYVGLSRAQDKMGYRDVIVAPFGSIAAFSDDARSRGIIVPGHEGHRLAMALSEVEPSGGLILVPQNERRRDMNTIAERKNRGALNHLVRLKASDWAVERVPLDDLASVYALVGHEVRLARERGSAVYLFPFGPKSVIFICAFELTRLYGHASWFAYPIPNMYDVNYTEGVHRTRWLFEENGPGKRAPHTRGYKITRAAL